MKNDEMRWEIKGSKSRARFPAESVHELPPSRKISDFNALSDIRHRMPEEEEEEETI